MSKMHKFINFLICSLLIVFILFFVASTIKILFLSNSTSNIDFNFTVLQTFIVVFSFLLLIVGYYGYNGIKESSANIATKEINKQIESISENYEAHIKALKESFQENLKKQNNDLKDYIDNKMINKTEKYEDTYKENKN